MSEKNKHFVTIISPKGESVSVDIDLSKEEYELVNRICVLFDATADINESVLTVSKPIEPTQTAAELETNPPTSPIPIIRDI